MPVEKRCGVDSCQERRIASFLDEDLCCNHFVGRCYAFLEAIDPTRDFAPDNKTKRAELKRLIEECAQRVLEVALRSSTLTNVQRARLLDILLWTSDLTVASQPKKAATGIFFPIPETERVPNHKPGAKSWDNLPISLRSSLHS